MVRVVSFVLTMPARLDKDLEKVAHFSPLNCYQSGDAILGLSRVSRGRAQSLRRLYLCRHVG